jgi:hypothetical protein
MLCPQRSRETACVSAFDLSTIAIKPLVVPNLMKMFLYAAKLLGLDSAQCVVVEDGAVGIESAIAAGMWTVGLGPVARFTVCDSNRLKAAHVILPSLMNVRWSNLQK